MEGMDIKWFDWNHPYWRKLVKEGLERDLDKLDKAKWPKGSQDKAGEHYE